MLRSYSVIARSLENWLDSIQEVVEANRYKSTVIAHSVTRPTSRAGDISADSTDPNSRINQYANSSQASGTPGSQINRISDDPAVGNIMESLQKCLSVVASASMCVSSVRIWASRLTVVAFFEKGGGD